MNLKVLLAVLAAVLSPLLPGLVRTAPNVDQSPAALTGSPPAAPSGLHVEPIGLAPAEHPKSATSVRIPLTLSITQSPSPPAARTPHRISGQWISQRDGTEFQLTMPNAAPLAPAAVPPGPPLRKFVPASFEVPIASLGPGILRIQQCPSFSSATSGPDCHWSETAFETKGKPIPDASPGANAEIWRVPLLFTIVCLIVATLAVFLPGTSGLKIREAASRLTLEWKFDESWLANLNIAATWFTCITALGINQNSFDPYLHPSEYIAWTQLFVLATALSTSVFSLFKAPDGSPKGTKWGTAIGFYLAAALHLFGVSGQLLILRYAFLVFRGNGVIHPAAASILAWLPLLFGVPILYYVALRFHTAFRQPTRPFTLL
jgi:hypothetical protein